MGWRDRVQRWGVSLPPALLLGKNSVPGGCVAFVLEIAFGPSGAIRARCKPLLFGERKGSKERDRRAHTLFVDSELTGCCATWPEGLCLAGRMRLARAGAEELGVLALLAGLCVVGAASMVAAAHT